MFDSLNAIGKALVSLGWGALCAVLFLVGFGAYCLIRLLMDGRRLRERQIQWTQEERLRAQQSREEPVDEYQRCDFARHEDAKDWKERL